MRLREGERGAWGTTFDMVVCLKRSGLVLENTMNGVPFLQPRSGSAQLDAMNSQLVTSWDVGLSAAQIAAVKAQCIQLDRIINPDPLKHPLLVPAGRPNSQHPDRSACQPSSQPSSQPCAQDCCVKRSFANPRPAAPTPTGTRRGPQLPRTFWVEEPSGSGASASASTPRFYLEELALRILRHHTGTGQLEAADGPGASRPLPRHGAEWWVRVIQPRLHAGAASVSPAVGFHWDKCEASFRDSSLYIVPVLSTVTYLSGADDAGMASPTVVLDHPAPVAGEGLLLGDGEEAFISHCQRGKHIAFAGHLLHGAPTGVGEPMPAFMGGPRVTFMVNIWRESAWTDHTLARPLCPLPQRHARQLQQQQEGVLGCDWPITRAPVAAVRTVTASRTMPAFAYPMRVQSLAMTLDDRVSGEQLEPLFLSTFTATAEGRRVSEQIGISPPEAAAAVASAVVQGLAKGQVWIEAGATIKASLTVLVNFVAPTKPSWSEDSGTVAKPSAAHDESYDGDGVGVLVRSSDAMASTELYARVSATVSAPPSSVPAAPKRPRTAVDKTAGDTPPSKRRSPASLCPT